MANYLEEGTMDNQSYSRKYLQCTIEDYKYEVSMALLPLAGHIGLVFRKFYVSVKPIGIS